MFRCAAVDRRLHRGQDKEHYPFGSLIAAPAAGLIAAQTNPGRRQTESQAETAWLFLFGAAYVKTALPSATRCSLIFIRCAASAMVMGELWQTGKYRFAACVLIPRSPPRSKLASVAPIIPR
jgi:hypothetical protein